MGNQHLSPPRYVRIAYVSWGFERTASPTRVSPGLVKQKISEQPGYSNLSDIVPPPNWALRYGPTWNVSNIPPLNDDEGFQN